MLAYAQEYVSGGSVSDMLLKFGGLDEQIVRKYTHQILLGLVFLHEHNVVHCDVKGGNILGAQFTCFANAKVQILTPTCGPQCRRTAS